MPIEERHVHIIRKVTLNDNGPIIGQLLRWKDRVGYRTFRNKAHYFIKVRDFRNDQVGGFGIDKALFRNLIEGLQIRVDNNIKSFPGIEFILIRYEDVNGKVHDYYSDIGQWMGDNTPFKPHRGVMALLPSEVLLADFAKAKGDSASTYGVQKIIPMSRMIEVT